MTIRLTDLVRLDGDKVVALVNRVAIRQAREMVGVEVLVVSTPASASAH